MKAKADAERAKAESERKEAEEKAKAEKKAKNAPDRDKLIEFAKRLEMLDLPVLKSDEANIILENSKVLLVKI